MINPEQRQLGSRRNTNNHVRKFAQAFSALLLLPPLTVGCSAETPADRPYIAYFGMECPKETTPKVNSVRYHQLVSPSRQRLTTVPAVLASCVGKDNEVQEPPLTLLSTISPANEAPKDGSAVAQDFFTWGNPNIGKIGERSLLAISYVHGGKNEPTVFNIVGPVRYPDQTIFFIDFGSQGYLEGQTQKITGVTQYTLTEEELSQTNLWPK